MQDTQTGEMLPIENLSQEAKDKAQPERARQGITLTVGEILDVKGGRFRVASLGRKMIMLEGLAGTTVET